MGLFIFLTLVSYLYFSMRSVSPENQLSSLPPNLTALVLTLLEVRGVDSMTTEMKTHFTEKISRDGARDVAIGCS